MSVGLRIFPSLNSSSIKYALNILHLLKDQLNLTKKISMKNIPVPSRFSIYVICYFQVNRTFSKENIDKRFYQTIF